MEVLLCKAQILNIPRKSLRKAFLVTLLTKHPKKGKQKGKRDNTFSQYTFDLKGKCQDADILLFTSTPTFDAATYEVIMTNYFQIQVFFVSNAFNSASVLLKLLIRHCFTETRYILNICLYVYV